MLFTYEAIGHLQTPFTEKFGVPRQSLMMSEARGILKLGAHHSYHHALKHLDQFSHIWLIFVFDKNSTKPWHPLIDTPRNEVSERMGVFIRLNGTAFSYETPTYKDFGAYDSVMSRQKIIV